jgi:hypothetical protein
MGASGCCCFFASPLIRGAKYFSHYRSMPWIDSAKKIRRKTASGNGHFTISSAKTMSNVFFSKHRMSFDLGSVFVYRFSNV